MTLERLKWAAVIVLVVLLALLIVRLVALARGTPL